MTDQNAIDAAAGVPVLYTESKPKTFFQELRKKRHKMAMVSPLFQRAGTIRKKRLKNREVPK